VIRKNGSGRKRENLKVSQSVTQHYQAKKNLHFKDGSQDKLRERI